MADKNHICSGDKRMDTSRDTDTPTNHRPPLFSPTAHPWSLHNLCHLSPPYPEHRPSWVGSRHSDATPQTRKMTISYCNAGQGLRVSVISRLALSLSPLFCRLEKPQQRPSQK